jgi:hypothetical protein
MSSHVEANKARLQFLILLDRSDRVSVTDWEAKFIESHVDKVYVEFTPKQVEVIDKMIEKYAFRIGWSE